MSCDSDPARLVAGLRASRSAQSHRLRLPIRLRQCSTVCRSNLRTALRRLRWLGAVTWAAPGGGGKAARNRRRWRQRRAGLPGTCRRGLRKPALRLVTEFSVACQSAWRRCGGGWRCRWRLTNGPAARPVPASGTALGTRAAGLSGRCAGALAARGALPGGIRARKCFEVCLGALPQPTGASAGGPPGNASRCACKGFDGACTGALPGTPWQGCQGRGALGAKKTAPRGAPIKACGAVYKTVAKL